MQISLIQYNYVVLGKAQEWAKELRRDREGYGYVQSNDTDFLPLLCRCKALALCSNSLLVF
jgi:hypothetical protein